MPKQPLASRSAILYAQERFKHGVPRVKIAAELKAYYHINISPTNLSYWGVNKRAQAELEDPLIQEKIYDVREMIETHGVDAAEACRLKDLAPDVYHAAGFFDRCITKKRRGRGKITPEILEKAKELLNEGASITGIAEKFEVSRQALYDHGLCRNRSPK